MAELDEQKIERYSRQLLIPGWGSHEQSRLGQLHLAVSAQAPAFALYLAGAGCGRMSVLFDENEALVRRIRALNPLVETSGWTAAMPKPDLTAVLRDDAARLPAALRAGPVEHLAPGFSDQTLAAALVIKRLVIEDQAQSA